MKAVKVYICDRERSRSLYRSLGKHSQAEMVRNLFGYENNLSGGQQTLMTGHSGVGTKWHPCIRRNEETVMTRTDFRAGKSLEEQNNVPIDASGVICNVSYVMITTRTCLLYTSRCV